MHPHAVFIGKCAQRKCAAVGHRLQRVLDEIHQRLFHLTGIQRRSLQFIGERLLQLHLPILNLGTEEGQGVLHDFIE